MASASKVSSQLEPWCDLEGKVVLITGASSGLGWDFCINLAKAGCKVIAAARRVDRLKSLCDQINQSSITPRAVALELDVTADDPAIEAAVEKAWATFGHIDCLINNAGIRGSTSSTIELTKEEWDSVFKTNLDGAWLCSKYVGIRMRDAGKGGSIVNISSIFGLSRVQSNGSLAYSSSKAGLHAMTTVMALDFGTYNIRVNAVAPSIFQSEITKELFQQEWLKNVVKKILPLQYTATVDPALTSVLRYLIHDSSKYVTGNIFIVDAGTTLPGNKGPFQFSLLRKCLAESVKLLMTSKAWSQLEPWRDLDGKVVLVTGASAGLGREFCTDLAKAGCGIVAAARRADRLKSLCDEINQYSNTPRAVALELDVTADRKAIEAAAQKAWAAFGRIDVLINNAGIRGGTDSSLDIAEDEWEDVFKTNLDGAWLVSKYIGRRMRDAGQGGSIINISTIFGLDRVQQYGSVAYGSSKAGMNNMTKVMALELGRYKIRVNAIAPAIFPSEITEELFKKKWLKDVTKKTTPLQTSGTSDPALTSVVRYLIHDSSQYVSGNIFIVDCGATLAGIPIYSSL